ncbi:P1 family peptidase [Pseudomonas fluorescens]|uniref:Beta-peptidyl aminopeptidase BapA n=1 Tax=Pseudomonas fluorescens TaxID=294 RepID=A0A5E7AXN1_PSEFL|nr:P1 family peptidase [Pseudomonas fluorescens]VVN83886.1 Beta-peptidyl aminopeptidase BapA [Pseudomonas fluorescens]
MRLRDLGITIGLGNPGIHNAITDVPGVRVGHHTLNVESGETSIHTGVTVIEPRAVAAHLEPCFAGIHVLNGNGDATGLEWIREAGLLTTPIAYTNTHSVGVVRDALVAAEREMAKLHTYWCMPVVLETYDGVLSDIWGQHVTAEHVQAALAAARSGPVQEGCVGGGTGMICHEFKGGIGTSSRVLSAEQGGWTVGALVQANYGVRGALRVAGYPVGGVLDDVPSPFEGAANVGEPGMGSIVITIATDAPLLPHQCTRLAQRASVGLARVGGGTEDSSGDIFIAFSVGNRGLPIANHGCPGEPTTALQMVNNDYISALFVAAADAVEEAILNAMLGASDLEGCGNRALALKPEQLLSAMRKVGWQPRMS